MPGPQTSALDPGTIADLRAHATRAAEHSYAPYSRFRVGAALLLDHPHAGIVITAANVENTSFRLSTCAEQAAIARAVAELGPAIRLRAVAVANLNAAASAPCGACRQTLLEFAPDPAAVTVLFPGTAADGSLTHGSCSLADLLPRSFVFHPPPDL